VEESDEVKVGLVVVALHSYQHMVNQCASSVLKLHKYPTFIALTTLGGQEEQHVVYKTSLWQGPSSVLDCQLTLVNKENWPVY